MFKVFSPRSIFRHLSVDGMQAIFDLLQIDHAHIDWCLEPRQLNPLLQQFYDQLEGSVQHTLLDAFRRVFNMADNQGITAIKQASKYDEALNDQLRTMDTDYDRVLFVLINHSDLFREAEKLYEFWGRQNGASYKRHQIMGEFNLNDSLFDQKELGKVVGEILKKEGANGQCHVEHTENLGDGCALISFYTEGMRKGSDEFDDRGFQRRLIRPAIESAIMYNPDTGEIGTYIKGGKRNHEKLVQHFAKHVLKAPVKVEEIVSPEYKLNNIAKGLQGVDRNLLGILSLRVRTAKWKHKQKHGVKIDINASPEIKESDALDESQIELKTPDQYSLLAATFAVTWRDENKKECQFSFDCRATGSDTLGNLMPAEKLLAEKIIEACRLL